MRRRRLLGLTSIAAGVIAGCSSRKTSTEDPTSTPHQPSSSPSPPATATTDNPTETAVESPRTIFVSPGGDDSNRGTAEAPLARIQTAIEEAHGGDIIRVAPGTYHESLSTVRAGSSEQPITLTGPEDAVVRNERQPLVRIRHDHFHLRGLTINGLRNPDRPEDPDSYVGHLIHCIPPRSTDEYMTGVVIAPAGVGNSRRSMILINRTKNLEIGPLKVTGFGGANYNAAGATGEGHVGEVVYLGTPPEVALHDEPRPYYPWTELDQSRNVHIHHIDNSAGHPHAELVNTKLGTRNVLIEYCTSLGGSNNTEPYETAEVRFQSHNATVRWCNLQNGQGHGVHIVSHRNILEDHPEAVMSPEQAGVGHAIYGNVLWNFGARTVAMRPGPSAQKMLCGNTLDGVVEGDFLGSCGPEVPTGDGVGHAHISGDSLPTLERLGLRFAISQQPSGDEDRHLAFLCRRLELVGADGEPTLTVNVGGGERNVALTGGVLDVFDDGSDTWRWFGGEDGTIGLHVPSTALDSAETLILDGETPWSENSVSLYRNDASVSTTTLSDDGTGTYSLRLNPE